MANPRDAFAPGGVPTLKTALSRAQRLGCTVKHMRGGEVVVRYQFADRTLSATVNARRKDASKALLGLIREMERQNAVSTRR